MGDDGDERGDTDCGAQYHKTVEASSVGDVGVLELAKPVVSGSFGVSLNKARQAIQEDRWLRATANI